MALSNESMVFNPQRMVDFVAFLPSAIALENMAQARCRTLVRASLEGSRGSEEDTLG